MHVDRRGRPDVHAGGQGEPLGARVFCRGHHTQAVTRQTRIRRNGQDQYLGGPIIPRYRGTIIHDRWASYFSYHQSEDGLCGLHLLRELEFIIDSNGYTWAKNMKRLLKETCTKVSSRKRNKLTEKENANLQRRYRKILMRGISELAARPERPSGKRGRLAQSDVQNLWDQLYEHE